MIEYLSLMTNALPPQAQEAFASFNRHNTFKDAHEDFERARNSCWHYLTAQGIEFDFENRENCAVRAVLCLLQREPPQIDLANTCDWFLLFADQTEDHSEQSMVSSKNISEVVWTVATRVSDYLPD